MRSSILSMAIAGAVSFATAAHADCQGVKAIDRCLVGTWKMTGGGAEEWMRKNLKGVHVASVSAANNNVILKADGTFITGKVTTKATVVSDKDKTTGTGTTAMQASGKWSAASGKLNFCPVTLNSNGNVQMKSASGSTMTMTTPKMQVTNNTVAYTCNGNALTTVRSMPRGTTMTTIYTKVP